VLFPSSSDEKEEEDNAKNPTFARYVWFCTETATALLDATARTSRK